MKSIRDRLYRKVCKKTNKAANPTHMDRWSYLYDMVQREVERRLRWVETSLKW